MIRTILFEDNKSFRQNLGLFLSSSDAVNLVGSYADANEAVAKTLRLKPDVILMDIQMPGISGIEAMQQILKVRPETKVLIQTVFEEDDKVFAAICGGAAGYVLKSPDPEIILNAIQDVARGGAHMSPTIAMKVLQMFQHQFVRSEPTYVALTSRELEILGLMTKGMSYKMIANACFLSYHTIHWHVKNIYEKLHVNSAPEAVAKAINGKLV